MVSMIATAQYPLVTHRRVTTSVPPESIAPPRTLPEPRWYHIAGAWAIVWIIGIASVIGLPVILAGIGVSLIPARAWRFIGRVLLPLACIGAAIWFSLT